MDKDEAAYVTELKEAYEEEKSKNIQQGTALNSMLTGQDPNLIEWQLELKELLDEIFHLLSGHQLKTDEKGNEYWAEPDDERLKPFNDYGVKLLMNVMKFYLNRNTLLANYSLEQVEWKVYDFGKEIGALIYMKYEEMGMDTKDKQKLYPMICRCLIDSVHSAFTRALGGGERESLRSGRLVTQNENISQQPQQTQRRRSIFRPTTWGLK